MNHPDLQRRANNPGWKWSESAAPPEVDMQRLRAYRLNRVREEMKLLDCGACVLIDPVNLRYATGARNMQVFLSRNPARYLFLPVDGPVILFEFDRCLHLSSGLETISEVRPATTVSFASAGERIDEKARLWAAEIADLMRQYGCDSRRIGVERVNFAAASALEELGFELIDAQKPLEQARAVKSSDEIACIKWSLQVTEAGVARMQDAIRPGMTENQLWSILHQSIIADNGEYIETRLLSSGPRTNPWMQESSPRLIENGDLVALDTDVVGPFGYYADFSRTFYCGHGRPNPEQRMLYQLAFEQIQYNLELLKPGKSFREIAETAWKIPEPYLENRYFLLGHGVGMTGEYPYLYHLEDFEAGYDGLLEENMTLCIESYIGEHNASGNPDGKEGVKLEQQVRITKNGYELLSNFPFDESLLGA